MYKYYGIIGDSQEWTIPEELFSDTTGWTLMNGPRPDPTYYASENGEWLIGPAPQIVQQMLVEATQKQKDMLSHASDMIGAITDEIEGLEEAEEDVPDKLRADLKAWKQYRVKVKNIDASLTPDIEWPTVPE
ncbi:tail fiber assembly protein [Yersinia enterocolitica]|uniref:tail fiber assembly protein n=1 Tax=Yersinia enterocolitica TaxID=630 RepID=UPI0032122287|nr:tail fiber assembly protein [Yersinia enterocolitica]EKN3832826.1 tail fiber assembly protein [Yersinia enterocolitica]EKN5087793.1 phage tail protein [Yersinia enterocolitica]EKN6368934.1 phage tail protein [Yersinia enterocolitica]